MNTSKNRPLWNDLPASVRGDIEQLIGGPVVHARSCPGGFSPGFASRLTRADGRRVFVKAMHADTWPWEAAQHRTEALVAAALPAAVPAPQFLGMLDDDHWTVLAFEDINGTEPPQPWDHTGLDRVAAAVAQLAQAVTPSPIALPRDHPRLGGWADVARDQPSLAQLPAHSAWAADNMSLLLELEEQGILAAHGDSLVHFDLYPHNILLTPETVVFVDWPHARLGAPIVDLVMVLSSAAADGIDPEPALRSHAAPQSSSKQRSTRSWPLMPASCSAVRWHRRLLGWNRSPRPNFASASAR
jgi:Ser/Thr protein kinase RdoA (MazF antagonist)